MTPDPWTWWLLSVALVLLAIGLAATWRATRPLGRRT